MTGYDIAAITYTIVALVIGIPCAWPLIFGTKLHPGGPLFDESPHFNETQRKRLQQNYDRIKGTLRFWKGKAAGYTRIHYYCVIFTIVSSWAVPLISGIVSDTTQAKWLILVISSHIALALSFHRGLNVSENMQVFRHGESEFYDLNRRLLDTPDDFGEDAEKQVDEYFRQVADLRRFVRRQETETVPSVDDRKHCKK
ncbi:MAG: hypothetical protein D3908_15975 [Candidatus Electrothrix sp. AUS4]|nr:hypothetical protein [Candidatus Electrothrix sp. AUS4]